MLNFRRAQRINYGAWAFAQARELLSAPVIGWTDPSLVSVKRTLPLPDRLVSVLKAAKTRQGHTYTVRCRCGCGSVAFGVRRGYPAVEVSRESACPPTGVGSMRRSHHLSSVDLLALAAVAETSV